MTNASSMIEAHGLTKFYGPKKAISDVSFTLERGEILGFLGPNGAGKTTTMKILTCYISPNAGTAKVNGHDVFESSLQARMNTGYLPESAPLYTEMTVLEDLQFFAEMRGVPKAKRMKAIKQVVDVCGLGGVIGHEIRELSKGFRQRVGLAQAMVHNPDILVLDEPTSGLDPNQIVEIRDLIKELGKEKTIILSTHNLAEVQATCSRVIVINKGKVAADGTVDELIGDQAAKEQSTRRTGPYRGTGRRHTIITRRGSLDDARKAIEKLVDVASTEEGRVSKKGEAELLVFPKGALDLRSEIAKVVVEAGLPLLGLQYQEINLEDVFRGLTLDDESKKPKRSLEKKAKAEKEPEPEEEPEDEPEEEPEDDELDDDKEREE